MPNRSVRAVWTALALLVTLLAVPQAEAQAIVKLGPRLTIDLGDIADATGSDWALGADARVRSEDFPVQANGNIDYYPIDEDLTIQTFDVNVVFLFIAEEQSITPYAGLGLGVTRVSSDLDIGEDGFGDDTELGTNFVGGVEFELGLLTPFLEAQFTNGDDIDRFGLSGGLLFTF